MINNMKYSFVLKYIIGGAVVAFLLQYLFNEKVASGKPNADWLFEMERIWSLKDELRFSDRREIEEAYNRFTLSLGKSKNAKPHFYTSTMWQHFRCFSSRISWGVSHYPLC